MSVTAAIRKMMDAGLTVEQALVAAEAFETVGIKDTQAERRREKDRIRKADKRLRNSAESADSADTVSPKKETSPTPPKEKTTPSSSEAKASSLSVRDSFAEFWLAYPRREGSNPKKPAQAVFLRLVAKGVNPDRMIAAAKALAVEHPTPTRFVPQAITFLNQERFDDEEPVVTGNEFCPADWIATKFLVSRFRSERQTDPPPAIHGGKTGFMLPAEWVAIAKQRQDTNGSRLEN